MVGVIIRQVVKMKKTLVVFPNREVKGGSDAFGPMAWADALLKCHSTDAHCVGYAMADGKPTKRLNLGHLSDLIDQDREPLLNWVFVDVDNPDHERWTPEDAQTEWAWLEGPPELTDALFYSTRGGYRLVWQMAKPLPVSLAGDFIRQFTHYLEANGVPVDRQCIPQWNTLFRLPYVNRDGEDLDSFVDSTAIQKGSGLNWQPPTPLKREVKPRAASYQAKAAPPLTPLTPEEWASLEGQGGILEDQLEKLKAGQAIGRKGSRQSTMFKLAGAVVGHLGLDDPALAFRALGPSVLARSEEEGAPTLGELWDRLVYLVALEGGKKEAAKKVVKLMRQGQPPVVYRGSKFFVRSTERQTYVGPVDSVGLVQMLDQHFTTPGVIETTNQKGGPLSPTNLVQRYGRAALQVTYQMGLEDGYYSDRNFGTLHLGCCVPLEFEAEFNPQVATWLELFSGKHSEKVLDWLATAGQLDDPTCALYIHGPPGTGKGLFASGVAAMWGTGATSYNDAVGKFNSALTRNPVVHVDEYFAFFDGQDGFSGAFRSLIGDSTRQLRIKNQPSANLIGCPRLVICANNADALTLNENLTAQDLEAIAQRVLYVQHDDGAANYLKSLGGRATTKHWVMMADGSAGLVARHVKWLAENRQVTQGARFLVEGEMVDWHRDLMGASGLQGAVLCALAHYCHSQQYDEGVQPSQGALLVNAPSLKRLWGSLQSDKAPRETSLVKALRTLSNDKTVRRATAAGRLRFYKIEGADIIRTAENLQIGDTDNMKDFLSSGSEGDTDGGLYAVR